MSLQKESEWEKEFDTLMDGYFTVMGHHKSPDKEEIKSFIENLLEQERRRMSGEIEKIRKEVLYVKVEDDGTIDEHESYNQAITDALSIINKK